MRPIKLILFDLDDTLVHFDDYYEASVKDTFKSHFFTRDMNIDDLYGVFDEVNRALVQKLDSQQISIDEFRIKRFLFSMERVGKMTDVDTALEFERLYQRVAKSNMKPNEGVNKLIAELKDFYQIGVITNGSKDWQYDKLQAIGLNSVFPKDYVFISGEIGFEKPSPEIYHHVLRSSSVQSDQVLVVGDSWINDVMGPIQQGMQAVWLNKKNQAPGGPGPLAVISELEELRKILL
ncbi:HAD family hydrolase [Paenibacillus sp. NEAU-GSW1]|uniref:HAD family hydrolase n=1 Tax=Paenibacillus sp. NEAU-GSW1 TaxID=2682486 RepID=UPI0012E2D966|nr:HAD family hydrolase [Paenibacillus sp. NEAU-GSW1]MUT67406.1 HAD-IA family hydrolase [Paenibacillus sp. NEAU-GSW1]